MPRVHSLNTVRFFAGILSLGFITLFPEPVFVSFLFLLSVSHTFLALYYSRKNLSRVANAGRLQAFAMLSLIACAFTLMWLDTRYIYLVILGHHVFNEYYLSLDQFQKERGFSLSNAALFSFETLVFLATSLPVFAHLFFKVDPNIVFALLLASFTAVLLFSKTSRTHYAIFCGLGLTASIVFLYFVRGTADFAIFYHFIFWCFFPATKGSKILSTQTVQYAALTVVLAIAAVPLTLLMPGSLSLDVDQMSYVTRMFAYSHVCTTLALSTANPRALVNFFGRKRSLEEVTV